MLLRNPIVRASIALASVLLPGVAAAQTPTLSVTYPSHAKLSPAMSKLHGSMMVTGPTVIHRPMPNLGSNPPRPDGALQTAPGTTLGVTGVTGFAGMNVYEGGYIPSDNNIAVGPNHIVETVNSALSIYDKSGKRLSGPIALKNLWTYLTGSACAANNGGDPIVQYDRAADRWMVTQLGSLSSPYSECVAVSTSPDPGGTYYLYSYSFGTNLNDYPKWSVWPTATNSAYLATYNLFANGRSFAGPEICAYDRAAMLRGDASPAALCYTGIGGASYLPSDLDGSTPPPDGTPGYFVSLNASTLGLYTLAPDFATKTATLIGPSQLGVSTYTQAAPSPQPGTARTLDPLSDRLMNRLAYRVLPGGAQSMVVNHSVVGGSGNSGVRWYELRASGGTFAIRQQGTYAPDASYRWMGSTAMDQAGNIALGYSVSDATSTYPSIRFTGQSPNDGSGAMGSETTIIAGSGSQTGYSRWGDYSSMRIDPSDDCTFWYVNEYLPATSSYGWYTWIGSFRFSNCGSSSDFSMSAQPSSLNVRRGNAAAPSAIGVTAINGFASSVNLSVANCLSSNSRCEFGSNPVYPGDSSTLQFTPGADLQPGAYSLAVTGSSGGLTHSVSVTANVSALIVPSAGNITVARRSSGNTIVSVQSDGGGAFPVNLSVSGLPKGVAAKWSNATVTANGANATTLTLTANQSTVKGTYTPTVTGTGDGGSTGSASFSLTIR